MQTLRHAFNWTIVALVSIAVGLILLSAQVTFHLAGLMLIFYGVVLLWWRFEATVPVVQAQVTRIAHRVRGQAFR
jgi:sulfite exporter TauE/SafE